MWRHLSSGATTLGSELKNQYDGIGNPVTRRKGGGHAGGTLRKSTFTVNALNQITNRTVPNRLELLGSTPAASVTVNGSATVRQAERYGIEIPVNNSTSATQVNLTVVATQGAESLSKTLKRDHPAANQAYSYDSDGNLLNDGIWAYSWDAENRLISSEYQLATTDADKRKYNYVYDHQSRRVLKRELLWNTTRSTWYAERQTKYIYDGWNVVVELFNENTVWKKHTWGLDLSGSMQGAGGVGGLLATENILKNYAAALTYDGNGNVTTLVKKGTSTLLAKYEYTAFGRTLTKSGKHANDNLYRFSTKPQEAHNNWYYYGYRYYDPVTGRWPSRDPIEEEDGANLFVFLTNDGLNSTDLLGLKKGGSESSYEAANTAGVQALIDSRAELEAGIKRAKKNKVKKPIPNKPREYGGRVCENCDELTQELTYYTTLRKGPYVARGRQGRINVGLSPKCDDGDKLVGFWHSHPGIRRESIKRAKRLKDKDTIVIEYTSGGGLSPEDRNYVTSGIYKGTKMNIYATYYTQYGGSITKTESYPD